MKQKLLKLTIVLTIEKAASDLNFRDESIGIIAESLECNS